MNKEQKQTGNWTCDGEIINGNEIRVRIHRQVLNLFASGLQINENPKIRHKIASCFNCFRKENFS